MSGSAFGGGIIFVVAALLWAVVLVPIWVRRREFRTAERNALRLQRTMRLLAETSEVPREVRAEANARQALAHEKLARTAQKRQEAEREAELAAARAEQKRAEIAARGMQRTEALVSRAERMRRPGVRKVRASAAVVSLIGIVGVLVGFGVLLSGAGGAILIASALAALSGVTLLLMLAPGATAPSVVPQQREVPVPAMDSVAETLDDSGDAQAEAEAAAAHAAAQQAAAARIARARALARARSQQPAPRANQPDSMLLSAEGRNGRAGIAATTSRGVAKSAQSAPGTSTTPAAPTAAPAPAAPVAPVASDAPVFPEQRVARVPAPLTPAETAERARRLSAAARLRKMGVVENPAEGAPDLEAALRRRRNVG
ncbi:hypothetical protein [Leucobacter sp. GX24907]